MAEIWKPIPGTAGNYEASSVGRVRVIKRSAGGRPVEPDGILMLTTSASGYPVVSIRSDKKRKTRGVHSCMLEAFVGPRPSPQHRASFVDGIPTNVILENLAWMTPLENHDNAKANDHVPLRESKIVNGQVCWLCRRCRIWQPTARFYKLTPTQSTNGRPMSRSGLASECNSCATDRRREHRQAALLNDGKAPNPLEKIESLLSEIDSIAGVVDEENPPTPAIRIRRAREAMGLSRAEIRRRSGLNMATMQTLEEGVRIPLPATVRKFLNALRGARAPTC